MRIVVLWGTIYSKNRGVNALARSAVELIRYFNPKSEIILIGSGKNSRDYFQKTVFQPMPSLIDLFKFYIISLIWKKHVLKKLFNDDYKKIDIVLDLSEGDSFTDIYGDMRFFTQIFSKILFRNISKRYILLPQTIGPFNKSFSQKAAIRVMNSSDIIYVRDLESKELVDNMTNKSSIFCYDLAFSLPPCEPKIVYPKTEGKVGINISGLLWNGGYTGKNQFGMNIDYKELMVDICISLIKKECRLVLIPHTYGSTIEDDLSASKSIKVILNNNGYDIDIVEQDYNEMELKWIISKCDFFIGSRMHSCIAALSSGVPAIAISYSRKFKGVFKSINAEEYVLDPRIQSREVILKELDGLFSKKIELKHRLLEAAPKITLTIQNTIKNSIEESK